MTYVELETLLREDAPSDPVLYLEILLYAVPRKSNLVIFGKSMLSLC